MAIVKQSAEEVANTLTHLLGIVMAIVIAWCMYFRFLERGTQSLFAVLTFSTAVFLMYTASSIYHWVLPSKFKKVLRYADHINIYVLIAASYTPILLIAVGGVLGWIVFGVMWFFVVAGAYYKILFLGRYPRLSLALYLAMGWLGVFATIPAWRNINSSVLWMLLLEGFFYTTGTYFYSKDRQFPFYHAIWHLFVLGGTLSHCAAVWLLL